MDRNLGASRMALSMGDEKAYGDLYQWGRGTDGHEKLTSTTTTSQIPSGDTETATFITTLEVPWVFWYNAQKGIFCHPNLGAVRTQ